MITYKIHIRGLGKDQNGIERVVYATRTQVLKLAELRADHEKNIDFVSIGQFMFSPRDILFVERTNKESYELPIYFKEKAAEEKALGLPEGGEYGCII